jgi:hypothetical protein
MPVHTKPSLFENLAGLPACQQQRLVDEVRHYYHALDRAIGRVLAPSVGRTGDQFMVADEVIPLYGVGATPEEAMADYRSVVIEYCEGLEEDADELGQALQGQLAVLRQVFAQVDQEKVL